MNAPVDFKVIEGMLHRNYKQIEVDFDPEYATAWTFLTPSGVPCFNPGLLEELRAHERGPIGLPGAITVGLGRDVLRETLALGFPERAE